ncbi:antibiotic biosynthesis monooxygenase (plasmid) [Bradyrhizobium sp. 62B]|uniref:putative quinol monooxygenase n=1 Tax=Bradyrhizobium sp. 62B TaxID=2898442 RepID=UPI002557D55E|nr:antibiotic biosynthesis monooxygenase [Bradyrhizobium sp. 62B]
MSGTLAIVARFVAKAGCEEELRATLLVAAAIALAEEPGCRRFEILQAVNPDGVVLPDTFMSNELFDDYEAVEAHRNSGHAPVRKARIRALVSSQTRIEMGAVIDEA